MVQEIQKQRVLVERSDVRNEEEDLVAAAVHEQNLLHRPYFLQEILLQEFNPRAQPVPHSACLHRSSSQSRGEEYQRLKRNIFAPFLERAGVPRLKH